MSGSKKAPQDDAPVSPEVDDTTDEGVETDGTEPEGFGQSEG